MNVARLLVQMVLGIVLPLGLQLWDRRRLRPVERARMWNWASWGSAIYGFDEMSMLGWFWVTRRWRGILPGIASSLALYVVIRVGVDTVVAQALGLRPPRWDGALLLYGIQLGLAVVIWLIALAAERRSR